jgi:hypothetical protein
MVTVQMKTSKADNSNRMSLALAHFMDCTTRTHCMALMSSSVTDTSPSSIRNAAGAVISPNSHSIYTHLHSQHCESRIVKARKSRCMYVLMCRKPRSQASCQKFKQIEPAAGIVMK